MVAPLVVLTVGMKVNEKDNWSAVCLVEKRVAK
jgi:hypothetical protein